MKDLSNENIIHVKKDKIEYIQFRKLLQYKELVHCFTLKVYDFDIGGNDTYKENKEQFINNYKNISNELDINYNNIIRPYQTHTDIVKSVYKKVEEITIFPQELENVDGLLTNQKDIVFSLGYADCTPLFLYDPVKKVIGNIHSGWRGTLQKIGQKAVEKMIQEYECNPKDIICAIGPTIRKCHFEVDQDVKDLFYDEFKNYNQIHDIIQKDDKKYYIDTVSLNKLTLQEIGLKKQNIIDSKICTVCNSELIHSYRAKGNLAGRNTAIIGLKE